MIFNKRTIITLLVVGLFFAIFIFQLRYMSLKQESDYLIINTDYYTNPSLTNNILKIFLAPFEFNYYELFMRREDEKNINNEYRIIFNNNSTILNNEKEVKLGTIGLYEHLKIQITSKNRNLTKFPGTYVYVKPSLSESIIKTLLFEISLLGVLLMFRKLEEIIMENKYRKI